MHKPDATDSALVQMPVMSGEESTAAIRKYEAENNLRRIVILALSANVTSASSNRVLDNGAGRRTLCKLDGLNADSLVQTHSCQNQ